MTSRIRFWNAGDGDHNNNEMKKFDVLEMKMVTDCKKKPYKR
jgi:hypothetical protein